MNNKKLSKRLPILIVNIIVCIFLIICLFSVTVTVLAKTDDDGAASIFGYQMRLVVSNSMEECEQTDVSKYDIKSIPVNSMVFIETVPEDKAEANEWYSKLKKGDVLTIKYVYTTQVIITHRIVDIYKNSAGGYTINLAGDNKNVGGNQLQQTINTASNDTFNCVVGKVVGSSSVVGNVVSFMQTPIGLLLVIILPCFVIILLEALRIARVIGENRRKREKDGMDKEIETLRQRLAELENTQECSEASNEQKNVE